MKRGVLIIRNRDRRETAQQNHFTDLLAAATTYRGSRLLIIIIVFLSHRDTNSDRHLYFCHKVLYVGLGRDLTRINKVRT